MEGRVVSSRSLGIPLYGGSGPLGWIIRVCLGQKKFAKLAMMLISELDTGVCIITNLGILLSVRCC